MNPTTEPDSVTPRPKPSVTAVAEGTRRAKLELTELLEAAARILPEYTNKLDRLVESTLTIWDRREKQPVRNTRDAAALAPTGPFEPTDYAKQLARGKDVAAAVGRDLDPFLQIALARLGDEFVGLSEPLRQWITKLSATLEEGRLTEVQRMELRLRLTDLEMKFQTAGRLLKQLNVLGPT